MQYDKTQLAFLIEKYAKFESYSKVKAAYCKEFKVKKYFLLLEYKES